VLKQFIKHTDLVVSLIIGGHGFEGQFESLACNPDIVIATPGRLMQHFNETGLTLSKVEMLIFDEADFLFEMGFRDQLNVILKKVGDHRQTLLFSATIPEELSNFARVIEIRVGWAERLHFCEIR
jgi:ATP-dependent RNA helicase DDX54/DBP10